MKNIKFSHLLALLFIGLKLTKHIDWAWGWVLMPIWVSLAVSFLKGFVKGVKKGLKKQDGPGRH